MTETAIQKTEKQRRTVMQSLAENQEKIEQALAGSLDPVQFMSICARVFNSTPKLREAPWHSFVIACVEAAQLGLTPGNVLGECYIIPRWNRDTESQWAYFQLGYRGAMKLARRGGELLDISPELVFENDEFHESKGTSRSIHHVPWYCMGHEEGGEVIAAYCTAKLKTGEVAFRTITREDIDKARARTATKWAECSNVWRDHFEAMALKTAVHRLAKFLPIPDAAKEAIIRDEYREAGVDEATITVDGYAAQRQAMLENPDLKLREAHKAAMGKAWRRAIKFCERAGVEMTRSNGVFYSLIMFLASDADPWPAGVENRGEQLKLLERAIGHLDQWAAAGDEGDALCAEFAAFVNGQAVEEHFEDEPLPDWEARAEEQFEASQGGE